jgi:DNA polymerase-3 subunit alpha
MKYVSLHNHTTFSQGDGFNYPSDHYKFVVENAESESMAYAITEHGNMNSMGYAIQAEAELKKKGINFKPIFGNEMYIIPSIEQWRLDKQKAKEEAEDKKKAAREDDVDDSSIEIEEETKNSKYYNPIKRRHHLVVLAQNNIGLKNLFALTTLSNMGDNYYYYPRVDFNLLEKHNEGLIISSACMGGPLNYVILREFNNGEEAVMSALEKEMKPLFDIFGKERAFVELQFNGLPEQKICNHFLVKFASKFGYDLVVTSDSHFARPEFWKEREMYKMLARQSKGFKVSKDDLPDSVEDLKCHLYPKNGEQMLSEYRKYNPELDEKLVKDAINRTYDIAHHHIEKIKIDSTIKLPVSSKDPESDLREMALLGLKKRGFSNNDEYKSRLERELNVICKKGYAPYFLVLKKSVDALSEKQLLGFGRGSAVGSMVLYCLEITGIDPIKNNLLFERFLSENRNDNPDCDLDTSNREYSLEILRDTFGEDRVVGITNYNTLQLKSLIKDLSKFYEIPFQEVNAVTSVMEEEAKWRILDEIGNDQKLYVFDYDNALKHSETFRGFVNKYPDIGKSIKILFRNLRSLGAHAGGTAILQNEISDLPFIKVLGSKQTPFSEGLTAKHLEQFGVIKFDFLSLKTLEIIKSCIENILKKEGKQASFESIKDFYEKNLSPDIIGDGDPEVFRNIYWNSKYFNIFQFTQGGVQDFCTKAKPSTVNDIANITALYRPGPLGGGADVKYLERIEDQTLYKNEHPIIQEVLGDTFGLIIYQEQFMLLAHKLAGFTLTESDDLRKLLVKPVTSLGEEMKNKRIEAGEKFIAGCINSGMSKKRAEKLWNEEILNFISYGFNKSLHFSEKITTYTEDGKILDLPISKVEPGMIVKTRNEASKFDEFVKVKDKHDHGVIDVFEIDLDDGAKVRCTMNHKFRVEDGRMLPVWQIMKENLNIVALDAENK